MSPRWAPASAAASAATDIQSTSTVTTTTSSSGGSNGSTSRDASPERSHFERVWTIDEFDVEDLEVIDGFAPQPYFGRNRSSQGAPSSRGLPRCGLVNFQKEGDNLRWAPRVTQNSGGVAARVHNFEDAFSLEEFSSRALPVVWQSTGGNPRTSISDDDAKAKKMGGEKSEGRKEAGKALSALHGTHSEWNDRTRSGHEAQKSITKTNSFKRTMAIAQEMRRPSFWSMLANNGTLQKQNGRVCLTSGQQAESAQLAPEDCMESRKVYHNTKRNGWGAVIGLRFSRGRGHGRKCNSKDSEESVPFRRTKKSSLLTRFVHQFDKRASAQQEEDELADEMQGLRFQDRARGSLAGDEMGEAQRALRVGRKHRSVCRGRKSGTYAGRRVRSSLSGSGDRVASRSPIANADDDQYVNFITSMS